MRMYLSSYGLGNHPEKLLELAGANKKVAVIMNARDGRPDDGREEKLLKEFNDLISIGLLPEEIDLRKYFNKEEELEDKLKEFGLLWVRGGNVFILSRAFRKSGFDTILEKMLKEDSIVYAGYSAAVYVVSPTLRGAELVDDPEIVPEGYTKEFNWDCLGLISYSIAVHYKSDHPESALIDKEVEYYEQNNMPYKTLRDGEVIIINGDKEELCK